MRITILGCGTSGGVPRVGGEWGACDPNEPKNRRRRCSTLVQQGDSTVVIDTAPDLREQLLDAEVKRLDAVIWTHDHADQCHGIDDVRMFYVRTGKRVEGWADERTLDSLMQRFGYVFAPPEGSMYPPIVKPNIIEGRFRVGEIDVLPLMQDHGGMPSLGFRFGDMAYCNDVVDLPEATFEALAGVKVWIVDAMRYRPHPSHAHVDRALEWIRRIKPERAVLTNMHIDLDYQTLRRELPPGVEPGYDGMVLEA